MSNGYMYRCFRCGADISSSVDGEKFYGFMPLRVNKLHERAIPELVNRSRAMIVFCEDCMKAAAPDIVEVLEKENTKELFGIYK